MSHDQPTPPPLVPSARIISAPPGHVLNNGTGPGVPNGVPPGPPPPHPTTTPANAPKRRGRPPKQPVKQPVLFYSNVPKPQLAPGPPQQQQHQQQQQQQTHPHRSAPPAQPPIPAPAQAPFRGRTGARAQVQALPPAPAPASSSKRPPVPFPPPYLPVPKKQRLDPPIDPTRLPLLPPFLSVAPPICRPREDVLKHPPPTVFSFGMKSIVLSTPGQVSLWKEQVETVARACGCYRELTSRFGLLPKPHTVEAFICKLRFQTCWTILSETVSGPIWAYMRCLGYNRIPVFRSMDEVQWQPSPVDAYYYAKQAGYRANTPGGPYQSRAEIPRMVEEVRIAKRHHYPTEEHFKKGIEWLRNVLDHMIRNGDRQVCESMYDSKPNWAPQWHPDAPYEAPWVLKGEPLLAVPKNITKAPPKADVRMAREKHERELEQAEADARIAMEEYRQQFVVAQQPPQPMQHAPPQTQGVQPPPPIPQQPQQQQQQQPQQTQQLPSRAGSSTPAHRQAESSASVQRQVEAIEIEDDEDEDENENGNDNGDEDEVFQDAEEGVPDILEEVEEEEEEEENEYGDGVGQADDDGKEDEDEDMLEE